MSRYSTTCESGEAELLELSTNAMQYYHVIPKGVTFSLLVLWRLEESGFHHRTLTIRKDIGGKILRSPRLSQDDIYPTTNQRNPTRVSSVKFRGPKNSIQFFVFFVAENPLRPRRPLR